MNPQDSDSIGRPPLTAPLDLSGAERSLIGGRLAVGFWFFGVSVFFVGSDAVVMAPLLVFRVDVSWIHYGSNAFLETAMKTKKNNIKQTEANVKDLSPKATVKGGIIAVLKPQMQDFH